MLRPKAHDASWSASIALPGAVQRRPLRLAAHQSSNSHGVLPRAPRKAFEERFRNTYNKCWRHMRVRQCPMRQREYLIHRAVFGGKYLYRACRMDTTEIHKTPYTSSPDARRRQTAATASTQSVRLGTRSVQTWR